jgi:hypothetical protein
MGEREQYLSIAAIPSEGEPRRSAINRWLRGQEQQFATHQGLSNSHFLLRAPMRA